MRKKYLMLSFLLAGIIGVSMFGSATAYPPRNRQDKPELLLEEDILEIVNADYLDLDDDGMEDDVVTEFIFRVPTGNIALMTCDLDMELELPSGYTYYTTFSFTKIFDEVSILLEWYNTATESGDYIFEVKIDFQGLDEMGYYISGHISSSIVFDPPIDGPVGGLPFGIIYLGF
ncbi:MAG: hypothetical protein ACTSWW_10710 [Promethearchaeota archaeon]